MSFDSDDDLVAVIASAMVPHRHKRGQICGECALAVARAVRGYLPAPWPPPRIDLTLNAKKPRRRVPQRDTSTGH